MIEFLNSEMYIEFKLKIEKKAFAIDSNHSFEKEFLKIA